MRERETPVIELKRNIFDYTKGNFDITSSITKKLGFIQMLDIIFRFEVSMFIEISVVAVFCRQYAEIS